MASDEIVWDIINNQFCSFKLKTTKDQNFCRNEYNVTGFCSKQSCPLANSRYATVRIDAKGQILLYMKTVERAHMPSRWWEKVKLSSNYAKALEQLDQHLIYWPKFLIHKCKQRLTRLTQVQIRTKKLQKEAERLGETMVPKLAPKVRRREEGRERKALSAAKVERAIERVLIERLRSGAYGDRPLNVEENVWQKVLKGLERAGEAEKDQDLDEGIDEDEEEKEYEYENGAGQVEYVSDIEGESDDDLQDLEDWVGGDSPDEGSSDEDDGSGSDEDEEKDDDDEETAGLKKVLAGLKRKRPAAPPPSRKKTSKGPKREIEYEIEREPVQREKLLA